MNGDALSFVENGLSFEVFQKHFLDSFFQVMKVLYYDQTPLVLKQKELELFRVLKLRSNDGQTLLLVEGFGYHFLEDKPTVRDNDDVVESSAEVVEGVDVHSVVFELDFLQHYREEQHHAPDLHLVNAQSLLVGNLVIQIETQLDLVLEGLLPTLALLERSLHFQEVLQYGVFFLLHVLNLHREVVLGNGSRHSLSTGPDFTQVVHHHQTIQ